MLHGLSGEFGLSFALKGFCRQGRRVEWRLRPGLVQVCALLTLLMFMPMPRGVLLGGGGWWKDSFAVNTKHHQTRLESLWWVKTYPTHTMAQKANSVHLFKVGSAGDRAIVDGRRPLKRQHDT